MGADQTDHDLSLPYVCVPLLDACVHNILYERRILASNFADDFPVPSFGSILHRNRPNEITRVLLLHGVEHH